LPISLLIDENLSGRLVNLIADSYPGSQHALDVGLGGASDEAIWEHAKMHQLVLLTKDEDFQQLSAMRGHPPKVLWIRLGNCSTEDVVNVLVTNRALIDQFVQDTDAAFLALGPALRKPIA